MSKMAKRILHFCAVLLLIVGFSYPMEVHAETKTANLVTLNETEDLTVMFRYDKEVVDIVFIAPDGTRYSEGNGNVKTSGGALWKVYQIKDAQVGTWKVEYDLKSNSEIKYSIRDDAGLWIRELNIVEQKNSTLTLSFMAEQKESGAYYDYIVTAIDVDSNECYELTRNAARAGKNETVDVSLRRLSSGNYVIQLQVYCTVGAAEVFDTATTDQFTYTNPSTPEKLSDVSVKIDSSNSSCLLDWSKAASWRNEEYKVVVKADGEVIFDSVFESAITQTDVTYPVDAKALDISLYHKTDAIWSEPLVKNVDLSKEYLNIEDIEVTGKGQIKLNYSVSGNTTLYLAINDKNGQYNISGEHELLVDLLEGSNKISAYFESGNHITYLVEKNVFYDAYPPTITLYDDINGKNVKSGSFDILGSVSDAEKLLVNGKECEIGENGSFCAPVELKAGENVVTLEVTDANGNSALMSLTLYKDNILESSGFSWIYLLVGVLVGAFVAVVAYFSSKAKKADKTEAEQPETEKPKKEKVKKEKVKKEKPEKKSHKIGFIFIGLLAAAVVIGWVALHVYVGSLDFLVLAETSTKQAMQIMLLYKGLMYLAVIAVVILVVLIVVKTGLLKKKKSSEKTENEEEKPIDKA